MTNAVREFHDACGDRIEKIPVVCYKKARAGIAGEKFLHPLNRLCVEMIRRLVEDKEIRTRDDRPADRHAPLLSAGKRCHVAEFPGHVQRMHCSLNSVFQVPAIPVMDMLFQKVPSRRRVRQGFVTLAAYR